MITYTADGADGVVDSLWWCVIESGAACREVPGGPRAIPGCDALSCLTILRLNTESVVVTAVGVAASLPDSEDVEDLLLTVHPTAETERADAEFLVRYSLERL